jgi:hypothetical protein
MMPMYGDHLAVGRIAWNTRSCEGWYRSKSGAESQRGNAHRDFETHVLFIPCLYLQRRLQREEAVPGAHRSVPSLQHVRSPSV